MIQIKHLYRFFFLGMSFTYGHAYPDQLEAAAVYEKKKLEISHLMFFFIGLSCGFFLFKCPSKKLKTDEEKLLTYVRELVSNESFFLLKKTEEISYEEILQFLKTKKISFYQAVN